MFGAPPLPPLQPPPGEQPAEQSSTAAPGEITFNCIEASGFNQHQWWSHCSYKCCVFSQCKSHNAETDVTVVHGGWSAWSPLSACSVTCGNGTQFRTRWSHNHICFLTLLICKKDTKSSIYLRSCTKPAPGPGGDGCQGEEREELPCAAATQCGQCG